MWPPCVMLAWNPRKLNEIAPATAKVDRKVIGLRISARFMT